MAKSNFSPIRMPTKRPVSGKDINRVQDEISAAMKDLAGKSGAGTKITSRDGSIGITPKSGVGSSVDLSVSELATLPASTGTVTLGTGNAPLVSSSLPSKFATIVIDGIRYTFPLWQVFVSTGGPPTVGLLVWLKGDAGVTLSGSNVTAWLDQSGNGYDHAYAGTDPITLDTAPGINGVPALVFPYAKYLGVEASTVPGGTTGSICVVYERLATDSYYNRVYDFFYPSNNFFLSNNNDGDTGQFWYGVSAARFHTTVGQTIGALMTWEPGSFNSYFNGWSTPFESTASSLSLADGSRVGGVGTHANQSAVAKIAEVLRWDHVLTDPERLQLAAYMGDKYGI